MKKIFSDSRVIIISLAYLCLFTSLFAQSPQKVSYQAVIRNHNNQLVINQNIGIRVKILQGSIYGAAVYVETHSGMTNSNGLVGFEIGEGTVVYGTFASIDWNAGPYYIETGTDPSGGENYQIFGTSQILSVPYSLHAKDAENLLGDITESQIKDLKDYLTSESDPSFNISPAQGISEDDLSNWNTAFSWGNHASSGYVLGQRTLTINGIKSDLNADRTWNVGTVTSVGLSLPGIFQVSGSPVTTTGSLSASFISQTANRIFASPNGINGIPVFRALVAADIPGLDWSKIISGKPTTLSGYGIVDGVNTTGNQTIGGIKTFSSTIMANNGMNANNKTIINVASPANAQDVATKEYVDLLRKEIDVLKDIAGIGIVGDIDGNTYNTIKIGTQVWMIENLKTTRYNDGNVIPLVTDNTAWTNLTTPGYCWFSNNEGNSIYGALYNWYAVNTGKLCPTGWHVPTDAEWTTLTTYLGGLSVAGGKIKSIRTYPDPHPRWLSPNTAATNEVGFSALPGGYREYSGSFQSLGQHAMFWTSTESTATNAWYRYTSYNVSSVSRVENNGKRRGDSVRCIKD